MVRWNRFIPPVRAAWAAMEFPGEWGTVQTEALRSEAPPAPGGLQLGSSGSSHGVLAGKQPAWQQSNRSLKATAARERSPFGPGPTRKELREELRELRSSQLAASGLAGEAIKAGGERAALGRDGLGTAPRGVRTQTPACPRLWGVWGFSQGCDEVTGGSGWEKWCLGFQKALGKSAELLRKLSRQEPWEEGPNSMRSFRVYREEEACAAMARLKDAPLPLGLEIRWGMRRAAAIQARGNRATGGPGWLDEPDCLPPRSPPPGCLFGWEAVTNYTLGGCFSS